MLKPKEAGEFILPRFFYRGEPMHTNTIEECRAVISMLEDAVKYEKGRADEVQTILDESTKALPGMNPVGIIVTVTCGILCTFGLVTLGRLVLDFI